MSRAINWSNSEVARFLRIIAADIRRGHDETDDFSKLTISQAQSMAEVLMMHGDRIAHALMQQSERDELSKLQR